MKTPESLETLGGVTISRDDASKKEASLFLIKYVKYENNGMSCGMVIVLVIGKLVENASVDLKTITSIALLALAC